MFHVFYALLLAGGQYYVWSQSEFTKSLLNAPVSSEVPTEGLISYFPFLLESGFGYFFLYSWGRFWLEAFLAVGVAIGFWLLLRALQRYQERFFEDGEVELGFLAALSAGWPNIVILIPLIFFSVVVVSVFRGIFLKEAYTTLGAPFLLAAFVTLLWGDKLVELFQLTVLRI